MRFATKLALLFSAILAMALIGTVLALWATHEARYHLERSDLAHRSYQTHLSLSNHTYQLFKQFGDAMMIGDQDNGALEARLLEAIRRDIADSRAIIASEIQLAGAEEADELEHLERIENHIEDLLDEYQTVLDSGYAIPFQDEWRRLSHILDEHVDEDFAQLIQQALDEERREVAERQAITFSRLQLNQALALIAAALGTIGTASAAWWLTTDIRRPVSRLIEGADAWAQGDRRHRIEVAGRSELASVAVAFNRMAQEIALRQQALEDTNRNLEHAVAERTAELERLLESLKQSESNRTQLLADVSHELRTPLTIIRGEADIALRGAEKTPEEYRLALQKAREAAQHTAKLVDDLLFIARRESGQPRLAFQELDLAALIAQVTEGARSLAAEHQGAVLVQNPHQSAVIWADPDRLRQVLLILLDNALRYAGGDIEVRLEQGDGCYMVTVTDQGPGLSQDERSRVFERFYRGSDANRHHRQGSGLGLPVAKAIAEAHGGEIEIQTGPGKGLAVHLTLPSHPSLGAVH